jgi:hypothetical protein|tara:strand:- start:4294 stop:4476 length:183 start_codon:yes stop_codon:yes gene_type:complete
MEPLPQQDIDNMTLYPPEQAEEFAMRAYITIQQLQKEKVQMILDAMESAAPRFNGRKVEI